MRTLRTLSLATALLMNGCACAAPGDKSPAEPPQVLDVDHLLATPDAFNNKMIRLDACLFVTLHGMSLFNCHHRRGEDVQLISFDPLDNDRDKAYQRVLDAGFDGLGKHMVKVTLTGEFHFYPDQTPRYAFLIRDADNFRKLEDPP